MDVCVLSRDLMFFTAAEGIVVASGHTIRQAEDVENIGEPDLLVADFVSFAQPIAELAARVDPDRSVIFTPHERADVFRDGRAQGFEVHRRGALANELPRILAERSPLYQG
jgi:hypothetical protein